MHLEQCIRQRVFKAFNSLLLLKRFQNPSMTSMFSNSLYIHCLLHTFHSSLPTLYKSNDLILLRFHPKSHLPSSPSPYNLFDEDINQTFKPEPMRSGSQHSQGDVYIEGKS